jgi:hypothetical protein
MRCECQHRPHHDRDAVRVTVSFDAHELTFRRTPFGLIVELAGAKASGPAGGPALPRRVIKVAVPQMQWPTGLTIENEQWVFVTHEPTFVAPVQPLRPGVDDTAGSTYPNDNRHGTEPGCRRVRDHGPSEFPEPFPPPPVVPPDVRLYEQELRSPRPLARALGIEQAGLARIAQIELNPLRFTRTARACTLRPGAHHQR